MSLTSIDTHRQVATTAGTELIAGSIHGVYCGILRDLYPVRDATERYSDFQSDFLLGQS